MVLFQFQWRHQDCPIATGERDLPATMTVSPFWPTNNHFCAVLGGTEIMADGQVAQRFKLDHGKY